MEVTVRLPPRPASTLAHVFRVCMHARMASDAGKYVTLHGVFRPGGISPQTARDA